MTLWILASDWSDLWILASDWLVVTGARVTREDAGPGQADNCHQIRLLRNGNDIESDT